MKRSSFGLSVAVVLLCATTSQALFVQGELTDFDERFDRFQSGYDLAPVPNTSEQFIGKGYDWSGVCWDSSFNKRSYVQISPLHFLAVKHWGGTREYLRYFTQKGQLYTAYQAAVVYPYDDSGIGTLTAPIPESTGIMSYPVLHRQYFNRYFNGAPATAQFTGTDTASQGTWKGVRGIDGFQILGNISQHPNYCVVIVTNQSSFTWAATTSDVRALQKFDHDTNRVAASWYSSAQFTIDMFITDGRSHRLSLYCLDWDDSGRQQRIDVIDALSNQVIDTRTVTAFRDGKYLTWELTGHVRINVVKVAGPNAVISGLFFDNGVTQPQRTAVPAHMCYEDMPIMMYGWSARVGNNEVHGSASTRYKYYLPGDAKWTDGWSRGEGYDSGSATFIPWNGRLTLAGNHNTAVTENWITNFNVTRGLNNVMAPTGYSLRFVGPPENIWRGAAGSDFNGAANWSLNTAPAAPFTATGAQWNNGTHVGFAANTAATRDVSLPRDGWGAGISFTADAAGAGFHLTGPGTLIVSRVGLNNYNNATQVVDCNILLHESQWWTSETGALQVNGNVNNDGKVLVVAGAGATEINGILSGAAALAKEETGTLTLRGANTYAGSTYIRKGTLLAGNTSGSATGTGAVQVEAAAVLGGSGSIGGSVTVKGTLAPTALTVANTADFATGSKLSIRVNGTSAGRLNVLGNLKLNDAADFEIDPGSNLAGAKMHVIASYTGALTGKFRNATLPAGWTLDFSTAGEIRLVKPANAPPVIASQPWATPNPVVLPANTTVTVAANDPDDAASALTYTWSLVNGPGTATFSPNNASNAATSTVTLSAPGIYTLRVTVGDGTGTAAASLVVTATASAPPPNPPAPDPTPVATAPTPPSAPTVPLDPPATATETPGGNDPVDVPEPVPQPHAVRVLKLAGNMKFNAANKDSLSVSGMLEGVPALNPAGSVFSVSVGGAHEEFVLDTKGRGKSRHGKATLKLAKQFDGGAVLFTVSLKNGTWAADWADEGVDPTLNAIGVAVPINVTVMLAGNAYTATVPAHYSVSPGKKGKLSN